MEGDMATWLLFPNQQAAQAGVDVIDIHKGYPVGPDAVTQTWAEPRQTADGKWAVAKCGDEHIEGVEGFEVADDIEWPSPDQEHD